MCASVCQPVSVLCELDEINGRRRRYLRRAWDVRAGGGGEGAEVGFGGLWAAKWDRRVGRVRFNSDSDVRVGHVDWQAAFGATVRPLFLRLLARAACDKKRGQRGTEGNLASR